MIGVVGDDETAAEVADTVRAAGGSPVTGPAASVLAADPTEVAAIGEHALVELVRAGVDVPVLAVGTIEGLPTVRFDDAVERLLAGDYPTVDHRLLSVETDGEPVGSAVFDVLLVSTQPGRISEYGVEVGETWSRFRADGVVVATPAGSHGYAHAAGGPRLGREANVVAVVPVAAFGLGAPIWVLDAADGLTLRVERDEGAVSVLLDGTDRRTLSGRATVSLAWGRRLQVVSIPE